MVGVDGSGGEGGKFFNGAACQAREKVRQGAFAMGQGSYLRPWPRLNRYELEALC